MTQNFNGELIQSPLKRECNLPDLKCQQGTMYATELASASVILSHTQNASDLCGSTLHGQRCTFLE